MRFYILCRKNTHTFLEFFGKVVTVRKTAPVSNIGHTLITGACINTGVAIVEKFAKNGWNVVFTGRKPEMVRAKEKEYKIQFPDAQIIGYHIDSLINETTVDSL